MKSFLCALAFVASILSCTPPVESSNNTNSAPTLKNWRVYITAPSIDGTTTAAISGQANLTSPCPFPSNTPVVLIGTKPLQVIPQAQTPYLIQGNTGAAGPFSMVDPWTGVAISNTVTGPNDVKNNYYLYALDWTTITTARISHSGNVYTVPAPGLQVGNTVYLAGAGSNTKATGAYLVATVPTANTFTLSGGDPGSGDSFHFLAKVKSTAGNVSF